MFNVEQEVLRAEKRIQPWVRETYLERSIPLSKLTGCQIFLKCENLQFTGSFKVRGAFNKLLSLTPEEKEKGVIAASTGNHGAGVAYALSKLNIKGKILVPHHAQKTKVDNIRNYGIVDFFGNDCVETEVHAKEIAKEQNMTYLAPYNDPYVIAGQGTIGIELMRQLDKIDAVFAPVAGGGLIGGIAGYLKVHSPHTLCIGCLPENSPVFYESIKAGRIIEMNTQPTLSDATAGGIEPDSITFELCQKVIDDYILVSEEEIKEAMLAVLGYQHMLIEGAAGVALASLLKEKERFKNKNVVIILSGANIGLEVLKKVLLAF